MGSRRSGKIASVLAADLAHKGVFNTATTQPGPAVTRPAGIAKPLTAA